MTKFELSISTTYVPNWGIVEAFRELFQNALDNEIENPENKMGFVYDKSIGAMRITNKKSSLTADTLLLGSTTKAGDSRTIGQHGEGYKIAFMVLLRNNKQVTVYNYGAKELWKVRLVKSKKYNGQLVTTVFVDKAHIWQKVPDNDLTILVEGITQEEYDMVVAKNLHLRKEYPKSLVSPRGRILLDESEEGNIYVKGLFVATKKDFDYGYDFEPGVMVLDRDRRLLDSTRVAFETAQLWVDAAVKDEAVKRKMTEMFKRNVVDVRYITKSWVQNLETAVDAVAQDFIEENGSDAVPVVSNVEYDMVKSSGKKPVIVNEDVKAAIEKSSYCEVVQVEKPKTIRELFDDFFCEIAHKLSDEEAEYMAELIKKISN